MSDLKILENMRSKLVSLVEPLLNRQTDEGYFQQPDPEAPRAFDYQAIYPFCYLYKTKFKGNIYFKEERLLKSILKLGDYFSKNTNSNGLIYYYSFGNSGFTIDQRLLVFWLDAYELMKNDLDKKDKENWVATMKRSLVYLEKKIESYLPQEVFNSYSFNTSPNHASLYACALYNGGVVFKNNYWKSLAENFMDRFVAFQSAEGYWPEGHGPVGQYCSTTLAGVARMNRLYKKEKYNSALFKAFQYFYKISYPDFSFVELTDKRNLYHKFSLTWGFHGLSNTPEGRTFALKAIEANLNTTKEFTGEGFARLLENYVYMKRGAVKTYKNWNGKQFLGNHSVFIRKNSWQINYSVNPVVVHPHSSFRLDYGKVYSVWHKSVGLLVDGSQGKNNDNHNTFYTDKGEKLDVLFGGQLNTNTKDPSVIALYASGAKLEVKTKFVSASEILLSGEQNHPTKNVKGLRFNVPLRLQLNDEIIVGKKKILLSAKKISLKVKSGSVIKIFNQKVHLKLHCDGVLHFPELPFNPYSSDNKSSIDHAFLRLELIPQGNPLKAAIGIKVAE